MARLRKKIEARLKEKNMSIAELARRIGRNRYTLYNWFKGRSDVRSDIIENIMHELGMKVENKHAKNEIRNADSGRGD